MSEPQKRGHLQPGARRRQLHVWVSDREYDRLRSLASTNDESISAVLRRAIRQTTSVAAPAAHPVRVTR